MDKKISQMAPVPTLTGTELVMLVVPGVNNFQITVAELLAGLSAMPITAASIGLGNVDNTHDADKPVSTAVQTALTALSDAIALKAAASHTHAISDVIDLQSTLSGITTALGTKLTSTDLTALEVSIAALTQDLAAKANSADVTTALASKADVTALDAKANSADVTTALAAKADTTALAGKADAVHSHAIGDVTGLQGALDAKANSADMTTALAAKADTTALDAKANSVDVTTALAAKADTTALDAKANSADVTTALAAKANSVHAHLAADITDLSTAIKALTQPHFIVVVGALTNASADLQVGFSTTNGYAMATVAVRARYKLSTDSVWTDLTDQAFVNAQLNYVFSLATLVASSNYDYEVYLADTNNPNLVFVNAGSFATPA